MTKCDVEESELSLERDRNDKDRWDCRERQIDK